MGRDRISVIYLPLMNIPISFIKKGCYELNKKSLNSVIKFQEIKIEFEAKEELVFIYKILYFR